MSLPSSETRNDKHQSSGLQPYEQDPIHRSYHSPPRVKSPAMDELTVPETKPARSASIVSQSSGQFLAAPPFHAANRPMSPDTFSNLSVEEYDQLRPRSLSPAPRRHASLDSSAGHEKLARGRRDWKPRIRAIWYHNLGLLYMLVAMLFGSLMNVTTRMLEVEGNHGEGLHPFQILFARMSITVVLAMAYMWWTKTPHFPFGAPEVRWLLVARGMGGFFGVFGMYYSILYLQMAEATVITFLAPSLSCWACSFLINEPFTRIEKMGSLVAFVGVIFIARPTSLFARSSPDALPGASTGDVVMGAGNGTATPFPDASNYDNVTPAERLAAVGMALVGVFGSVCAFTTIRWIGRRAHPLISVNYFAVWCTIVSTVAQLAIPEIGFLLPADAREWGLLLFLGACGFIMQFLLAAGLSYEKSSRATNMTYTSMLFALTFDKVIFGQTPGFMSIVGSTLILGSAVYMAVHRDGGASGKDQEEASGPRREGSVEVGDLEEGVGLIGAMEEGEAGGSVKGSGYWSVDGNGSERGMELRDLGEG